MNTIFDRDAIPAVTQLRRYGDRAPRDHRRHDASASSQRIFGTTGLTFDQWCICIGLAASLVVVEELIKLVGRRRQPAPEVVALPTLVPARA